MQFSFGEDERKVKYKIPQHCVVYTGTHDNDTILGWLEEMAPEDRAFAQRYMNNEKSVAEELPWDFIRLAMASVADLAVIPVQDYLGLGTEARINKPSTLGYNWKWRLKRGQLQEDVLEKMYDMTKLYGRIS